MIIDGKAEAAKLRARIGVAVAGLGFQPGLAVVLVGDDPASAVYVRNKGIATRAAGMASTEHRLSASASEAEILAVVAALNADAAVDGILVQLPLPRGIDSARVLATVAPEKDVDGFHVENVGRLWSGQAAMVPCTPLGCLRLLRGVHASLAGMAAVVVGRSNIVGKPMAALLLGADCTVTLAHSRTRDLGAVCRGADILVAAVGRPGMIGADWVRPGATVIDVGINRVAGPDGTSRLVGDVDFAAVEQVAGAITPVPGGVGPMTIACLLGNTVAAACRARGIAPPEV